jgi:TfoX/Sxy family transcriptional regulator of competence genes
MAWKKSPPELIAAFARVVPSGGGAERHPMFGYPAAFVNGNMFAGLHEDRVVLRLDEAGIAEAKQHGATDFEPMPGRRMTGWVAVTGALSADEPALRRWVARAFRHTETLPPKARRKAAGSRPSPRGAARSRRAR